jgi:hypothetical protein
MINILVHLPTNHTSSYLILNDFFVKIIKDKKKNKNFVHHTMMLWLFY